MLFESSELGIFDYVIMILFFIDEFEVKEKLNEKELSI